MAEFGRQQHVVFAVSVAVAAASAAGLALLVFVIAFAVSSMASGVTLQGLLALFLLGCGMAMCGMIAFVGASFANWYLNANQLRKRLFKIRAAATPLP